MRITKIKWSSWGASKAVGRGRYSGKRVTITLSGPDACGLGAQPWFNRARFAVAGSSAFSMDLAGPCS